MANSNNDSDSKGQGFQNSSTNSSSSRGRPKAEITESKTGRTESIICPGIPPSISADIPSDLRDIFSYRDIRRSLTNPKCRVLHTVRGNEEKEFPCCSSDLRYYERTFVQPASSVNTCGTKKTTVIDQFDDIALLDESLSEAAEEEEERDLCLNCERKRVIASEEYYDILIEEQYEDDTEDEEKGKKDVKERSRRKKKDKQKKKMKRVIQKYRCRVCGYARKERETISKHVEVHFEKEEIYYCFDCQKHMNKITLDSIKDPKHKHRMIQTTRKEQMNKPPTMRKMSVIPRCAECDCIFDYLFSAIQKLVDCYEYSYVDDYGNVSTIAMYFCRFCRKERRQKHLMENHVFNHLLANEVLCKPCQERKDQEKGESEKKGKTPADDKKAPWERSHREEDLVPKPKPETEDEKVEPEISENSTKRKHRRTKKTRERKSRMKDKSSKKKEADKKANREDKKDDTEDKEKVDKKHKSKHKGKHKSKHKAENLRKSRKK